MDECYTKHIRREANIFNYCEIVEDNGQIYTLYVQVSGGQLILDAVFNLHCTCVVVSRDVSNDNTFVKYDFIHA